MKGPNDLHQVDVLDLHRIQGGEGAHDNTRSRPSEAQERVLLQKRQTVCCWPQGPNDEETSQDLTVSVTQSLYIVKSLCAI